MAKQKWMKRRLGRVFRVAIVSSILGMPALAQHGSYYAPPAPPVANPAAGAEARLAEAELSVTSTSEELEATRAHLRTIDEGLEGRVHALYRLRRAGMLPVAGGFDAMLSHLARTERLERMVHDDVETKRRLQRRARDLRARVAEAEATRDEAQQALAAAQAALPPDHGLNTFFDPNYTPRLPVAPVPQYGLQVHQREPRRFRSLRGNLPMPVVGSSTVADASREDGTGLEFGGRAGRGVRAVAEGTVAFARRYGVYGTMVVVDHGHSYFTVYAGLAQTHVNVGEAVRAEQSLGTTDGALYFEVRNGTRSLEARSWIGL